MQIHGPSKEAVLQALRSRAWTHAREGDVSLEARADEDLAVLSAAPGADLHEMHRLADATRRSPSHAGRMHAARVVGLGVGLPCALLGLHLGDPVAAVAGAAVLATCGIGFVVLHHLERQRTRAAAVVSAIERNQSWIRAYYPTHADSLQADPFLTALRTQERLLVERGEQGRAARLKAVREELQRMRGDTVGERFQALVRRGRGHALQELGPEIADAIADAAEVDRLLPPERLTRIREGKDAVVIGGVVLKKRVR